MIENDQNKVLGDQEGSVFASESFEGRQVDLGVLPGLRD